MRLSRAIKSGQQYPDGTSSTDVLLIFTDGANKAFKRVRITGCALKVSSDLSKEAHWLIMKASREAERDFAFMRYGDQWREHVTMGRFWSASISDEEKDIVQQAVDLVVENTH
jgi:hypothetical protein